MPNNYILGFDTDGAELEEKKIRAAREKVEQIASSILAHEHVYDVHEVKGAFAKTAFIRPMFNAFARSTRSFVADENCNGCGLCEQICPIGAIQMQNGKPVWVRSSCTQCLGCINRCPQRAIQYGEGTKKRDRYYFHLEQ